MGDALMSEARANYIHDRRLVSHDTLRKIVTAGNLLAHQIESFISECAALGAPEASEEEVRALKVWEGALAELRGEVQP